MKLTVEEEIEIGEVILGQLERGGKPDANGDVINLAQAMAFALHDKLMYGRPVKREHKPITEEYLAEKRRMIAEYELKKMEIKKAKELERLHRSRSAWEQQSALKKKEKDKRRAKTKAAKKARKR